MIDGSRRIRALLLVAFVPLLILAGVLAAGVLDGGGEACKREPPLSRGYAPPGTERLDIGAGVQAAAIFRTCGGGTPSAPVVVFLHGWAAVDPRLYGAWIGHLVSGGATVIYPAYQQAPYLDFVSPLANALVAIKAALAEVDLPAGRLVVAGHSAGGALAADVAASAQASKLPAPAAVFSVYPGRSLLRQAVLIPSVDARLIPPGTRVLVLGGERDRSVGTRMAREIARTATRADVTLRIVRNDAVDHHAAPVLSDAAARATFWAPLDRLVAQTAG